MRYIQILFHILFHYGLSQGIVYSSLCYPVGYWCLSILYTTVCLCYSQTPIPSLHSPTCYHTLAITSLFSISVSLLLFHRYVDLCHILDSTYKWYSVLSFDWKYKLMSSQQWKHNPRQWINEFISVYKMQVPDGHYTKRLSIQFLDDWSVTYVVL